MRFLVTAALMLSMACARAVSGHPPPTDRFYFPTGIAFAPAPGTANGVIYVASSNYDRRYDLGTVLAVSLDQVRDVNDAGLPSFGAPVASSGPMQLPNLNIGPQGAVTIQTFAGRVGLFGLPDGGQRLFVPSQAERSPLQIIDAEADTLNCLFVTNAQPTNCFANALSLTANANKPSDPGVPAAPQPWGVTVTPKGQVYVTHVYSADTPPGTQTNLAAYLVALDALAPALQLSNFIYIGSTGSWDVAAGARYAYISGVLPQPPVLSLQDTVVRMVDPVNLNAPPVPLRTQFQALEARGVAISPDEQRLYLVTRTPDALLVLDILGATSTSPQLQVARVVTLPAGPMEVRMIPRASGTDLLAITCETAGSLVFYDETLPLDLAGEVPGLGLEPVDLAVDVRPSNQARIYVTDQGDGRVAVVDVTDLESPQKASLVAQIGKPQTCIVQPSDPSCTGGSP
jgi:hypothetical protein